MEGQNHGEGAKTTHDNSTKSSNPNTENDHSSLILEREHTGPSHGLLNPTPEVNNHMTSNDKETEDFLNSFPPGYRFKPKDDELIYHYLERKIKDPSSLPPNKIKDVELYKFNPEYLATNHEPIGDNEWYFFTPRDRKYPNGERPNRAAGDGYWKATGADKSIDLDGVKIGSKKALVFYRGKPLKGIKTDWIMYEFGVSNPPKRKNVGEDMRLDDVVLCRMRKKKAEERPCSTRPHPKQRQNSTRQRQGHAPPVPHQVAAMHETNPLMIGPPPQHSNFQAPNFQAPTFPLRQPNPNPYPYPYPYPYPNPNPSSLMFPYRPYNDQLIENDIPSYDPYPLPLVPQEYVPDNGLPPLPGSFFNTSPHNDYPFSMTSNIRFGPSYTTFNMVPTLPNPPTPLFPPSSGGIEWPEEGFQDPHDHESQLLENILYPPLPPPPPPPPPPPHDHDHYHSPPDHRRR